MEVISALIRNTIDVQRASLIIRALHIAVKNAPRVKFGLREPVTKIPEYAPPTEQHEAIAQQSELPAVSAIPYKPIAPGDRHFWEYQEEGRRILDREAQADRVGTGAFARPAQAKPSASVGTDAHARPASAASVPAAAIPPHDFKTQQPATPQNALPKSPSAPEQTPSPRKPPETAKPAPQDRKNAARAASLRWVRKRRHGRMGRIKIALGLGSRRAAAQTDGP